MRRIVLHILVLILMFNLADDGRGRRGRAKFIPPDSSAETSVSPSHHPDSDKADFRHELASTDLLGRPQHADAQSVPLRVQPILQIIYCCCLSSSGAIPL